MDPAFCFEREAFDRYIFLEAGFDRDPGFRTDPAKSQQAIQRHLARA